MLEEIEIYVLFKELTLIRTLEQLTYSQLQKHYFTGKSQDMKAFCFCIALLCLILYLKLTFIIKVFPFQVK